MIFPMMSVSLFLCVSESDESIAAATAFTHSYSSIRATDQTSVCSVDCGPRPLGGLTTSTKMMTQLHRIEGK
jgi:hypothetical protein